MRVVFDSNVPLAALLFPEMRAAAAVKNIHDGRDDLVLSPPILREVLWVLARKFSRDREELSRVAVVLGEMRDREPIPPPDGLPGRTGQPDP